MEIKSLLGLLGLTAIMTIIGVGTYYLGQITIWFAIIPYMLFISFFMILCKRECDKIAIQGGKRK